MGILSRGLAFALACALLFTSFSHSKDAADATTDDNLAASVSNYLTTKPGLYSVTALELDGAKRELHQRDTTQVDPASIFKLYYAGFAYEKIQQGKWTLSTRLASNYSLQTCLRLMISFSDNECAVDIRNKLGIQHINSRLASLGLAGTHIVLDGNGNYLTKHTTTLDVANFLKKLQTGQLLDATQTSRFLNLLKAQVWRARISYPLPVGIQVGSKSGQLLTNNGMIEGDSAIIFGAESTYVLVVIGTSGATGSAVRGVSRLVYENWQGSIAKPASYSSRQLVSASRTYLRTKPGGRVIRNVYLGTPVKLIWSDRGWFYVQVGTSKGYLYQNTVRLSNRYLHWGAL